MALINAKNTQKIKSVNEKVHDGAVVVWFLTIVVTVGLWAFGEKETKGCNIPFTFFVRLKQYPKPYI